MRWMHIAGIIIVVVISISLWRAHTSDKLKDFSLFDILMENGRVSRIACFFAAAFVCSSWVIIELTVSKRLTEGYFTAYLTAFVAPIVAKLFAKEGGSNVTGNPSS